MEFLEAEEHYFKTLNDLWDKIYSAVTQIIGFTVEKPVPFQFEFELFGSKCFGRFIHNFEKGGFEFGLVEGFNPEERRVGTLVFDLNGKYISEKTEFRIKSGGDSRMVEDMLIALANEIRTTTIEQTD